MSVLYPYAMAVTMILLLYPVPTSGPTCGDRGIVETCFVHDWCVPDAMLVCSLVCTHISSTHIKFNGVHFSPEKNRKSSFSAVEYFIELIDTIDYNITTK